MSDKPILVTGATGAQGKALSKILLQRGVPVRAMTRNPAKPTAKQLAALGAEVVAGDLDDEESLNQACAGMYGVFALQNFWEKGVGFQREVDQGCKLARAAKQAGVEHFLQTSVAGCDNAAGVQHFQSKWAIEQYVDEIGLPRTFLREVFFMENFFEPVMGGSGKKAINPALVISVLQGCLNKDTSLHMVTVDDIAWFAAEIFSKPDQYLGKTLDIASDSLTVAQMKAAWRKVSGKRPLPVGLPAWALRLVNAEAARQYDWNNRTGWHFDLEPLREIKPDLTRFEDFLSHRLKDAENA